MDWVDHLLNFAGLLLWLGFRGVGFEGRNQRLPASRVPSGAAGAQAPFALALLVLLAGRSWVYWRAGTQLDWVPHLNLGVVAVPFNSALWSRMIGYSVASFAVAWATFHCCLNCLSILTHASRGTNPWAAGVARQLGVYARLPAFLKVLVPWGLVAGGWVLAVPALVHMNVALPPAAPAVVWQQGLVLGAMTLLVWKFVLIPVLLVYQWQNYAYLGRGAWIDFVKLTGARALRPVGWLPLRLGQLDLTPACLAVAILGLTWWGQLQLERLFHHLAS